MLHQAAAAETTKDERDCPKCSVKMVQVTNGYFCANCYHTEKSK